MDNRKVFYQALNLIVVVVAASATSFFATRYYVRNMIGQELSTNTGEIQSNTNQNGSRDPKDIAQEEADLKSRVQNSNEISGTVVEVGADFIKIQPSSESLGTCNDQVFISSYLRDRTMMIIGETKILKLELLAKKEAGTKLGVSDIKNGDYVMVMSKESIGTSAEFIASIVQISL